MNQQQIVSFTLAQVLRSVDPDHIHHAQYTAALKEPVLFKAYGSSLLFGTYSSKYMRNHTIWRQKVIFKDFIVIARDKKIPIEDSVRYALEHLDMHITCTCPAFLYYGYRYMATQLGYLYGLPKENRPPVVRNPHYRGTVCKHCDKVLRWVAAHEDEIIDRFATLYRHVDFTEAVDRYEEENPEEAARYEEEKRRVDNPEPAPEEQAEEDATLKEASSYTSGSPLVLSDAAGPSRTVQTVAFSFPPALKGVSDITSPSQHAGVLNVFGRGVIDRASGAVRLGPAGASHVGLSKGVPDAVRFYYGYAKDKATVYVVSKNSMDDDYLRKPQVLQVILSEVFTKFRLSVTPGKRLAFQSIESRTVPEEFSDKRLVQRAIKEFGLTDNSGLAFFVLPDGRMLDGSEANQGGGYMRSLDHHAVSQFFPDGGKDRHQDLMKFMRLSGCIRVDFNNGTVDSVGVPNREQIDTIAFALTEEAFLTVRTLNGQIAREFSMQRPTRAKLRAFYANPRTYGGEQDQDDWMMSSITSAKEDAKTPYLQRIFRTKAFKEFFSSGAMRSQAARKREPIVFLHGPHGRPLTIADSTRGFGQKIFTTSKGLAAQFDFATLYDPDHLPPSAVVLRVLNPLAITPEHADAPGHMSYPYFMSYMAGIPPEQVAVIAGGLKWFVMDGTRKRKLSDVYRQKALATTDIDEPGVPTELPPDDDPEAIASAVMPVMPMLALVPEAFAEISEFMLRKDAFDLLTKGRGYDAIVWTDTVHGEDALHFMPRADVQIKRLTDFVAPVQEVSNPKDLEARARKLLKKREPDPLSAQALLSLPAGDRPRFTTVYEAYRWFDERNRQLVAGLSETDLIARSAEALYSDSLFALTTSGSALGWYDAQFGQAMSIFSEFHPELLSSDLDRFLFTVSVAVTSNGLRVTDNFRLGEAVYRLYAKPKQRFPEDLSHVPGLVLTGVDGEPLKMKTMGSMESTFATVNAFIDKWGLDDTRKFFLQSQRAGDTNAVLNQILPRREDGKAWTTGEAADAFTRGAIVLGPKIGSFFSNLYGNYDLFTLDRWAIRTLNRVRGTLFNPITDAARDRLKRYQILLRHSTIETFQYDPEKDPFTFDQAAMADEIDAYFKLPEEDQRDPFKAADAMPLFGAYVRERANRLSSGKLDPDGSFVMVPGKVGKTGKTGKPSRQWKGRGFYPQNPKVGKESKNYPEDNMAKLLNDDLFAESTSATAGDRTMFKSVLTRVAQRLADEGITMTYADLQALLWYNEKYIVALMKGGKTDEFAAGEEGENDEEVKRQDYATAARLLAKELRGLQGA